MLCQLLIIASQPVALTVGRCSQAAAAAPRLPAAGAVEGLLLMVGTLRRLQCHTPPHLAAVFVHQKVPWGARLAATQ